MRQKQILNRKNANFLSSGRRYKLRKFFVMTMSIGLFLIGCATVAFNGSGQKVSGNFVVLDPKEEELVTKGLMRGLKIMGSKEFKVLFSVDEDGLVTAFVGGKPVSSYTLDFPIKEFKEIKKMTAITVFALNPEVCYINSAGDKICFTYP